MKTQVSPHSAWKRAEASPYGLQNILQNYLIKTELKYIL